MTRLLRQCSTRLAPPPLLQLQSRHFSAPSSTTSPKKRPRPKLLPAHDSLSTFETYAQSTALSRSSTVYIGTRYEYLCAASLARLGFRLTRVGGASDRGVDLRGAFRGPLGAAETPVLAQCKAFAPSPAQVRELEGVGRPVGFRAALLLLVARGEATRGVREAVQACRSPVGFVCVSAEGRVRQLVWNRAAEEGGLAGLGVGMRYGPEGEEVVFTVNGRAVKDCKG